MARRMISSLELARICGVSQGTVDRALHSRGRISDQTRRRILEAARKHGYTPNPAARELVNLRETSTCWASLSGLNMNTFSTSVLAGSNRETCFFSLSAIVALRGSV